MVRLFKIRGFGKYKMKIKVGESYDPKLLGEEVDQDGRRKAFVLKHYRIAAESHQINHAFGKTEPQPSNQPKNQQYMVVQIFDTLIKSPLEEILI